MLPKYLYSNYENGTCCFTSSRSCRLTFKTSFYYIKNLNITSTNFISLQPIVGNLGEVKVLPNIALNSLLVEVTLYYKSLTCQGRQVRANDLIFF